MYYRQNRLMLVTTFIVIINLLSAEQTNLKAKSDTLTLSQKKRNATVQAVGIDFSIWGYNRYIAKESWAKISIQSFRNNIEHGWVIDEDGFDVNQFGHPYQGSLVFTAARAQGLNFWQSIPYPILSSFIWEIGLEIEYPSINDMITTPLSGITYGEITHRLSLLILSENPGAGGEFLAFLVNPSLGLNRLFGNDNRRQSLIGKDYDGGISLGGGEFLLDKESLLFPQQFLRFHILYGNPFDNGLKEPFDYFTFVGIVNFGQRELVHEIYSSGLLKHLRTMNRPNYSRMTGIFKNYDYMNHDDFKVSSTSIGIGMIQSFLCASGISLYNEIASSFIILGSAGDTSDEESYPRDYLYGPGMSGKLVFVLENKQRWKVYLRLKRYLIYNYEDLTLSKYENVNLLKTGFQIHTWNSISLGGEYSVAMRQSVGNITLNDFQKNSIFRLYLIYNFGTVT